MLLKGKNLVEDAAALGVATETAVFKHLVTHYYPLNVRFSYWRGKKDHEVDLVAEVEGTVVPFEVKYRSQHTGPCDLKGLLELCSQKKVERGYVITRALDDFGTMDDAATNGCKIMKLPAPLLCYWMGATEVNRRVGASAGAD